MKTVLGFTIALALILFATPFAHARGGGGGCHGGGGAGGYHGGGESSGYHGGASSSSYHGGGFDMGGYHAGGAEASGYHAGGAEASGFHASSGEVSGFHASTGEASGYHAGGYEAGGYHAAGAAGHVGLPTDGAFGGSFSGEAARAGAFAHPTVPLSGSVAAARGTAVRNSFDGYGAFNHGWYGDHPGAWAAAGWGASTAWHAAAWSSVGAWCGWGNAAPVEYDYGNNVTYQDNQVYYGDQPVCTADQYYQQAATIAQTAPAPDAANNDWLPLGVFSLVQGDQSETNTMFQLAVNKAGAIAGNYNNILTGTTAPVHGFVDKKTQRAAWTVGANTTTVYDVGISSLTKDEAPLLIHIGKDKTQQWLLVRLQQPDQPNANGSP
jgi:hypothetical protein